MNGVGARLRPWGWAGGGALVLILLAAWGVQTLRARDAARTAFPQVDGSVALPGLKAQVVVHRDARGVPHARADSRADALFALGYVHAQDRLSQMLWLRHRALGRGAEILGEEAVEADHMARLVGFSRLAQRQLPQLDAATRGALLAYAAGVNARLDRIREGLVAAPAATGKLGLDTEPWSPDHSLAVFKLHAWGLGESVEASLVLDDMIRRLGADAAAGFFPGGGIGEGLPVPEKTASAGVVRGAAGGGLPAALRRALALDGFAPGSSAWVLGGSHSKSGGPLLAVDHHLPPTVPAWLHLAHLSGGDLDVAGVALPGVPVFWSGHNDQVTWAAVAAAAVVTDLYKEVLHRDGSDRYYDGRRWRDLDVRQEIIRVRGGDPVEVSVRATRHGPLLPSEGQDALAVSWTGARVAGRSGIGALLRVALAEDAIALVEALEGLHEPVLSVVYADADGMAGLQVAGWIPLRSLSGQLVPLEGRAPRYLWRDPVPFDALPSARLLDGEGWVVAADASLASRAREPIDWLWSNGARSARIEALLSETLRRGPVGLRDFAALQTDVGADRARRIVEAIETLVGASPEPLPPQAAELAGFLLSWDGSATADSRGAAAYHALLDPLYEGLLERWLGPDLWRRYLGLPRTDGEALLLELLRGAAADAAAGGERSAAVGELVRECLREAWLRLYRLGPNRDHWTWGALHAIHFRPFGGLAPRFPAWTLEARPFPGSAHTVRAAAYDPLDPFEVRIASTARLAFDAGALRESLAVVAPGQSEHPGHPHFDDQLEPWLDGHSGLLATGRLLVEETAVSRLVLEPVE